MNCQMKDSIPLSPSLISFHHCQKLKLTLRIQILNSMVVKISTYVAVHMCYAALLRQILLPSIKILAVQNKSHYGKLCSTFKM